MNHLLELTNHSGGLEPFARCTRKQRRIVDQLTTELSVHAGTVLARRGGAAREYIVIVDGCASAMVDGRVVASLGAGDDFGGGCIARNLTHPTTIVADTAMTLLVMGVREFRTAYSLVPSLHSHVDGEIARRVPGSAPTADPVGARAADREVDYTLAS